MTRLYAFASALALCAAAPVTAEPPDAAQVSEVVVTAQRLPPTPSDAPGFYVVGEAEIDSRGAVVAADVLETIPGLSVSRSGAFGGVTGIRQRGATSDKTLVLIDGVPVNDPSQPSGGYDLSSLDLADITRIEVLSGPQGSLWGSDAIGGVVSFTTRELDGWRADLEAGSFDTRRAALGIGRADEARAYGLSLAAFESDGISKAASGSEDDGFENLTATAYGRTMLGLVSLDGRVRYNDSEADTDGFPAPTFTLADTDERATSESWSGFARARVADLFGFDHSFSLSLYDLERAALGGDFPSSYTADRQLWRYLVERSGERYAFAAGLEREDIEARLSDGSRAEQGTTSAFAVARLTPVERLTTTLSLRHDAPDEVDGETTARGAAAYQLGGGFALRASYGQGFKTPTISQLACDFCFPGGPADLKPERAEGYDVGVAWEGARASASLTAYELKVRNQIDFVFGDDFSFRYRNIERTRSRGLEAAAEAELAGGLSARAAYAYTEAEDRTTGLPLPRVPEHQGSAVLSWSGGRLDGALTLRAEGDQADVDPTGLGRGEREGFVTADVAAGYEVLDGVRITLRIENLADETYEQALGYGEPGRGAYVGLKVRR
jgi:vitamin B12 transporter